MARESDNSVSLLMFKYVVPFAIYFAFVSAFLLYIRFELTQLFKYCHSEKSCFLESEALIPCGNISRNMFYKVFVVRHAVKVMASIADIAPLISNCFTSSQ